MTTTQKVYENCSDGMLAARLEELTHKMNRAREMDAKEAAAMYARLIGGVRREIIRREKKSKAING